MSSKDLFTTDQETSTAHLSFNEQFVITDCSPALCRLLGYEQKELSGSFLSLVVKEHQNSGFYQKLQVLAPGETLPPQKQIFTRKDGKTVAAISFYQRENTGVFSGYSVTDFAPETPHHSVSSIPDLQPSFFSYLEEGYCIIEVLFEGETATDCRFLEVNEAFEKQTGIANATGKTMRELFADGEASLLQTFGNVVVSNQSARFQHSSLYLNRVFDVYAGPEKKVPGGVAVLIRDITRQQMEEDVLRQSEERYRAIFNQATAGVSELDREGNVILANETFAQTLGYSFAELLTMNIRDFTHPDSLPVCLALFKSAIDNGQSSAQEKCLLRKDGSQIWITESISAIRENGYTRSVVGVGIDITNRKIAEQALKSSEERYRISLEAGELATWDWDVTNNIIVWNEQHYRLFGIHHKNNNIKPEYFLKFIHPDDIPYVTKQLQAVLGDAGVYIAEFRIIREDNHQMRWMNGYGRVTERVNGKATRISGVMYDTTDRREAKDSLEAAQNSLQTAIVAAQMGIWDLNLTTKYTERSLRHDQLLGYETWQAEWNLEKMQRYMPEEDKPKAAQAFENLMQHGVFELEARISKGKDETRWIYMYGKRFKEDSDDYNRAAGVIFDITDRKTIEKQKDDFIGVASHELKTPVTSIKAYAEILQDLFTQANDPQSAELMSKMEKQVDRLNNLIRDLLDVTKAAEGQLTISLKQCNLNDVITDTVEEMQRGRRQTIHLSKENLPLIEGDCDRLAQVFTNLISNAVKYSPDADKIVVKAGVVNDNIRISVQDFGIGMSPESLSRLFERFYRSDNPTARAFPGLGLGLFISMEIMRRHGGTIGVESEKGKGSTFTMVLPVTSV